MPKTPRILSRLAFALLLAGAAVAHADVLAHWSFDQLAGADHDTFLDSGGHKNADGAPMNALIADKGQISLNVASDVPFGKAVTFSGKTGGYLDVPALTGIHDHSFSIAVWVYLTKNDHNYVLTDWSAPLSFSYAFGFDETKGSSGSHITAYMKSDVVKTNKKKERYNVDVIKYNPPPAAVVSLNAWHHVAWVWDRVGKKEGTLTVYLDGEKVSSTPQARGSTTDLLNNHRGIKIGLKQSPEGNFHGSMDELWVFNDALTPEQVTNLMRTNDIAGAAQFGAATPTPPSAPASPSPSPAGEPPSAPAASPPAPSGIAATPTPAAPTEAEAVTPAAPESAPTMAQAAASSPPVAASPEPARPDFLQAAATAAAAPLPVRTIPQLAVVHRHYTPERILGILASGALALTLSSFLVWATLERSRMRNGRT